MTTQIARAETGSHHFMVYSFCLTVGIFYMHQPTDRLAHTMTFVTPVVEHGLEREIAQLVHLEGFLVPASVPQLVYKDCGMYYPVCGMMHIKEPLLLIRKSNLCGGSRFPLSLSEWSFTICLMLYNRK